MKISIIIPVLNEAAYAEQIMQNLQAVREHGHEIIVVDGGSDDGSVDRFSLYADKVISTERGRATQMNAGAAVASGEVFLFLHADTLLVDDFDKLIFAALQKSAWGFFFVRLSGQHYLFRIIETCMNYRSRLTSMATGDQCLYVRKQEFESLDGYTEIDLMEDIDLCKRLRRIQRPAVINTKVITSSRRWEESGIARTVLKMWWLRLSWFFGQDPTRLARQYD